MSLPRSVADALNDHVTLEVEGIDHVYLNVYQPQLQTERGVAACFRFHRGETFASAALMAPMRTAFITAVEEFVEREGVPMITFAKGQRKDDVAKQYHAQFQGHEGIVFVGKAQEKTPVFRTEKRRNPETGRTYPWIVRSTAVVNHIYFYGLDNDFGPFFLKFCTYFPYTAKLCINGHEYVKRQLAKEGIGFEARDNGILTCANPRRLQQLCDGLSASRINKLLRKWLARLPHPFTAKDRAAGYRYDVSIFQAEFSLTQVLDRPLSGRVFFEEVIRENLDIGRPDQVQLIFARRVTRRTKRRPRLTYKVTSNALARAAGWYPAARQPADITISARSASEGILPMSTHAPFNAGEPLAYFLTWTTYGTWLPGDDRGWHREGEPEVQLPNRFLVKMARSRMKKEFALSHEHRRLVERTIRRHCEVRRWALHAVNARTTHVHVVVTAAGYRPETVRDQLKAWCTRALKEAGAARSRFWTEGGRCDWINDESGLESVVTYVLEAQDRKGRDEAPRW